MASKNTKKDEEARKLAEKGVPLSEIKKKTGLPYDRVRSARNVVLEKRSKKQKPASS